MHSLSKVPLYWRVCLINGSVFLVGTAVLALSPATVSSRVLRSEAIVLTVGLAVILVTNALLLRASLAPLDRLMRVMERVDLLQRGQRLEVPGGGAVANLVRTFNRMLDRLEAERSISDARELAAQEAERNRIARELHDQIGQGLTVVLLGLSRAAETAPSGTAEELKSLRESVRTTLEEVSEVARRLRPGVLEDLGLQAALAALATDLSTHSGIHVRRVIPPGLPQLGPEAELVVYRVAQEALTNVARHSGAHSVEVSLTKQGAAVALRVADDGTGLRGAKPGAGIRGMQERALLVGARVEVDGTHGPGTQVRLVVPLEDGPP